jgi:hypothetical protein
MAAGGRRVLLSWHRRKKSTEAQSKGEGKSAKQGHLAGGYCRIAIMALWTMISICGNTSSASAFPPDVAWSEDFATDPVVAGRFSVPAGHDGSRFSYDAAGQFVTVHYDTFLPTAWYGRPLDPAGGRVLGRCDDFQFEVDFRIRSAGYFADPNNFMQIGWGLLNSATTGADRAGGSSGPYAFDCVTLDYFPNVSPQFGGPTLGPAVVHGNQGQGFFGAIDFPFGAETRIDPPLGEQPIPLDTVCTATVSYRSEAQTAELRIRAGPQPLNINAEGAGGPGGPDADPLTIQTTLVLTEPFAVDRFALTAWQDTFNLFGSSVIADVEISRIDFLAPALLMGDMNRDDRVDGRDIALFIETLLAAPPEACRLVRADFNNDSAATTDDIAGFIGVLLAP